VSSAQSFGNIAIVLGAAAGLLVIIDRVIRRFAPKIDQWLTNKITSLQAWFSYQKTWPYIDYLLHHKHSSDLFFVVTFLTLCGVIYLSYPIEDAPFDDAFLLLFFLLLSIAFYCLTRRIWAWGLNWIAAGNTAVDSLGRALLAVVVLCLSAFVIPWSDILPQIKLLQNPSFTLTFAGEVLSALVLSCSRAQNE
jgi:hypothetical protein